ncbi:MAG: tRNA-dihydrouridine synthase, partial [Brevundimonas sp.]
APVCPCCGGTDLERVLSRVRVRLSEETRMERLADPHRWGGLADLDHALAESRGLDGAMLGRAAYHTPAILGEADRRVFGVAQSDVDAYAALEAYRPYMAARLAEGVGLAAMTRHMLGLMHGRPGARAFRRILTVDSIKPGAGLEVLDRAVEAVRDAERRRAEAA